MNERDMRFSQSVTEMEKPLGGAIDEQEPAAQYFPLSFAQSRLWFLDQLDPGNPIYNGTSALRLVGNLDYDSLKRSFEVISQRHETLRTRFLAVDGQPLQVIDPPAPLA